MDPISNITIANCLEMFAEPGDDYKTLTDRAMPFLADQDVALEMAFHAFHSGRIVPEEILSKEAIEYFRTSAEKHDVPLVGHHWVGVGADNYFFLTHNSEEVRDATARHLAARNNVFYQLRGEVPGGVAVVGSPPQRNLRKADGTVNIRDITIGDIVYTAREHMDEDEAGYNMADTLARTVVYSKDSGVVMAPERLVHFDNNGETDVLYTMDKVANVVLYTRSMLSHRGHEDLMGRVAGMVDFKAAYGMGETPEQAAAELLRLLVPKGAASLFVPHFHTQGGGVGAPGYGNDGTWQGGPGYQDITPAVDYAVGLAAQGMKVTLSTEAFPPFWDAVRASGGTVMDVMKRSNEHMKGLVNGAAEQHK